MPDTAAEDQGHQFLTGFRVDFEAPAHGGGDGHRTGFANAANRHAGVARFQHDADPPGLEVGHDQIGQIFRHAFLDLGPIGQRLDSPGEFAQTQDPPVGEIGDVGLADEGKQVMLAARREFDVLDDHHVVVDLRERLLEMPRRIRVQSGKHFRIHPGYPVGRIEQSFAVGVFTDRNQDFTDSLSDPGLIDAGRFFGNDVIRVRLCLHCKVHDRSASNR